MIRLRTLPGRSSARVRRYLLTGGFLGLGAPVGAIVIRWLGRDDDAPILAWLTEEVSREAFFYNYLAIGTVLAFLVSALVAANLADALDHSSGTYRDQALIDELTGLPNRRYLDARMPEAIAHARRFNTDLTCVMVDIDRFKALNDAHGHLAGDAVLAGMAEALHDSARATDFIARFGGEEFVMLLPGTSLPGALRIAERLRQSIAKRNFRATAHPLQVTVSLGVAGLNHHADARELLAEVDARLYEAKQRGRNRVCGGDRPPDERVPTGARAGGV